MCNISFYNKKQKYITASAQSKLYKEYAQQISMEKLTYYRIIFYTECSNTNFYG